VKTWSPTVIVPVRGFAPKFREVEYVTAPLPIPVAPPVIEIQEALDVALQAQSLPAATRTRPENSALDEIDRAFGVSANPQGDEDGWVIRFTVPPRSST
jgi:hypothetical protein